MTRRARKRRRNAVDNPQYKAGALLSVWGWYYPLISDGLFPHTNEGEKPDVPPERVDQCGHSDPTYLMVIKRERLLSIDAAVRSVIPEQLRQRLYEQYIQQMTQDAAAARHGISESAWRRERNEARLIFWNLYHDRRRLARTPIPDSADERAALERKAEIRGIVSALRLPVEYGEKLLRCRCTVEQAREWAIEEAQGKVSQIS